MAIAPSFLILAFTFPCFKAYFENFVSDFLFFFLEQIVKRQADDDDSSSCAIPVPEGPCSEINGKTPSPTSVWHFVPESRWCEITLLYPDCDLEGALVFDTKGECLLTCDPLDEEEGEEEIDEDTETEAMNSIFDRIQRFLQELWLEIRKALDV